LENARNPMEHGQAYPELDLQDRHLASTEYAEIIEPILFNPARTASVAVSGQATRRLVPMSPNSGCIPCK